MPDASFSHRKWQIKMIRTGLPGLFHIPVKINLPGLRLRPPVRPADVDTGLQDALFNRAGILEDVNYQKILPNHYVVQVSPDNYDRQFLPIKQDILEQWRSRMLGGIITANTRQGRKEFRLGGRLMLDIESSHDLKESEARILYRIDVENSDEIFENYNDPVELVSNPSQGSSKSSTTAYLELLPEATWWTLYAGVNTIGRSGECQIYLDQPIVHEKRLISGEHAYILLENGLCTLFDGSPNGRPSANGTYVNLRRVPPSGILLENGDSILLAAIDPQKPVPDTPGVVVFQFYDHRGV